MADTIVRTYDGAEEIALIINSHINSPDMKDKLRCETQHGICFRISAITYPGYEFTEGVLEDTSHHLVKMGYPLAMWSYKKDGRGIQPSLIFDVYESLNRRGKKLATILNR
jgi:hypothetical protein